MICFGFAASISRQFLCSVNFSAKGINMFRVGRILLKNSLNPVIGLRSKENINLLQITIQHTERHLLNRSASTSFAGAANVTKVTPVGWLLLIIPITTFGLGCWQLKRKAWKEQLIKDMETLTKIPPVELPEDLSILKDMEYRVVRVKGTYLHDKELLMGPRSLIRPDGSETPGGLFSQLDGGSGFLIITPFKLSGRDDVILINRGWVSRKNIKLKSRLSGQTTDEVEMTCVVRKEEQRPQFVPEHKGDIFLYRNLRKMCELTGAQPVFLDATYDSSVVGGPVGGQTRVTMRNDHLSYLITWYSLSLATGFLWYRTILRKKAF